MSYAEESTKDPEKTSSEMPCTDEDIAKKEEPKSWMGQLGEAAIGNPDFGKDITDR